MATTPDTQPLPPQRDFEDTTSASAGLTMHMSDQELYEIERLAAKIILSEYNPRQRMSMRRALDRAVDAAGLAPTALSFPEREQGVARRATTVRIGEATKAKIQAIQAALGHGWTETAVVLASVAAMHASINHLEKRANRAGGPKP